MNIMTNELAVEKALKTFESELSGYELSKRLPGGVVLHLASIGETGYFIGTVTAFNSEGVKSEHALPFRKFMRIIEELEHLASAYRKAPFTGAVVGWKPKATLEKFLFEKKVHRLFFLNEESVLPFLKVYGNAARKEQRDRDGVNVLVMVG